MRSNGRMLLRNDEVSTQSLSLLSSTTEDEESQSLWQSSGTTGGGLGSRFRVARPGAACCVCCCGALGPLNDSTVLLMLLEVGLWGSIIWCP